MGTIFGFKSNRSVLFWILASFSLLLIGGCGPLSNSMAGTPMPVANPTCFPNEKFYTSYSGAIGAQSQKAADLVNRIYTNYINNPKDLELARSQAIQFLAFETMRWSHFEKIVLDDNNSVRVMVTFISPDLIRAVLLNHVLFGVAESPLSGTNLTDFSNNILLGMDDQKKYIFLIAIQPVTRNASITPFQIPSSQAILINNSGMNVKAINTDHFLDQGFNMSSSPQAGFIFYPFGNGGSNGCQRVLDPSRDTSMTLSVNALFGKEQRTITWEILFAPPLQVSGAFPTPDPSTDLSEEEKKPYKETSSIGLSEPQDDVSKRGIGRLIWGKLTYDNFYLP